MSDAALRALERRWRESGDPADEEALRQAQARAGLALVIRLEQRRHTEPVTDGRFLLGPLEDATGRWRNVVVDLDDDFNPEVGFVPRTGIRTSKIHFEYNPRPGRLGIRMMSPMYNVTYTTDQQGLLLSRRHHYMVGTRFENGAFLNVWYNRNYERLEAPFRLQSDVVIAPGAYSFGDWRFSFDSNPARRLYWGVAWSPQTFYGGTRTDASLSLGVRASSRIAAEAQYGRNDVDLPTGGFVVDLASLRLDVALSPAVTLRTLTQYNSLTEQWGTSARFRWTYMPGSDVWLVYDHVTRDPTGLVSDYTDRRLILKVTHLLTR